MLKPKEVLTVWKRVFRNWLYIALVLVIAFIFYLLNGLIINIPNIKSFYQLFGFFGGTKFLFTLAIRFIERITLFGSVTTIILSMMIGIFFTLLVYRFRIIK